MRAFRRVGRLVVLPALMAVAMGPPSVAQETERSSGQILARAVELHEAGNAEQATREYRAFLKRHPDVADVRSNLGAAYVRLGLFEEAISEYKRALAQGSATDPSAVRFNLALAYYKAAHLGPATEALTRVLAEQPDNKNAALLLANCRLSAGETQEVIALLSPLQEAHANDPALAYLLGTALLREGETAGAWQ